jgi:hypothetical protein
MTRLVASVSIAILACLPGATLALARDTGAGNDLAPMSVSAPLSNVPPLPPGVTVLAAYKQNGDMRPAVLATARTSLAQRVLAAVGAAVLSVLIVGAVMLRVQRSRRRRVTRWYMEPTQDAVAFTAFTPAQEVERTRDIPRPGDVGPRRVPGWHADPDHLSDQVYWDGEVWTARRRWSGTAWEEVE